MRIGRTSLLCCLMLCAGVALATNTTTVQFVDENGNLITNQQVGVATISSTGQAVKVTLPGESDGTYEIPAGPNQEVVFNVGNHKNHGLAVKLGQNNGSPVIVVVPMGGAPNDDCPNGQAISLPSTTAGSTVGGSTDGVVACGLAGAQTAAGVWYTLAGTGTNVRLSTCTADGGAASYDTKISVYCGNCAALTCVAGNDDGPAASCPAFSSQLDFCTQGTSSYRILVHGFGTGATSTGTFSLAASNLGTTCSATVDCTPPPVTGACCVTDEPPFAQGDVPVACSVTTAQVCAANGGVYQGDNSSCFTPSGGFDYVASGLALPIPDNAAAGVSHTINVPDDFIISDVNVDLGITHTWASDLVVTVTSPANNSQVIWNRACGSADNLNGTADQDAGVVNCAQTTTGPIDSVFFQPANFPTQPVGNLNAFDGADAIGAWRINVRDAFVGDVGTLNQWSLHFIAGAPVCAAFDCPTCPGCDSCCPPPEPCGGGGGTTGGGGGTTGGGGGSTGGGGGTHGQHPGNHGNGHGNHGNAEWDWNVDWDATQQESISNTAVDLGLR